MMYWILFIASPALLLLAAMVIVFLYTMVEQNFVRQKIKHIPGPQSSLKLIAEHNGETYLAVREIVNQFGYISKFNALVRPVVIIADPEAARFAMMTKNFPKGFFYDAARILFGDGLVVSEGEKWKRHRKLMTGGFTPSQLRSMLPSFQFHADALTERISKEITEHGGAHLRVDVLLTCVTLDIIATTALRYPLNTLQGENKDLGHAFRDILSETASSPLHLFPFGAYLTKLWCWRNFKLVNDVIRKAVVEARADPPPDVTQPRDLMDILIGARDPTSKQQMTNQEIHDELFIFFLAGHETTALTLTFCLYELTRAPEVMKKLREEVDYVCNGEMPAHEHLGQLKYLTMVLKETLRLHPPLASIGRYCTEEFVSNGLTIPAGASLFIAVDSIHMRADIYQEPFKFDPMRWTEEETLKRHSASFLPFTQGPRICIGQHFFWMEGRVLLARLIQKFNFAPAEDFKPVITSRTGTMKFKNGLELAVSPRA